MLAEPSLALLHSAPTAMCPAADPPCLHKHAHCKAALAAPQPQAQGIQRHFYRALVMEKKIPHSPTATSTSYADARGSVSCGSDVREKIGRREVDRSVSAKAGAAGCGEVWGTLAPAPAGPIGSRWPVRSSCAGAAASSGSSAG